jgi:hypothetical protein
MVAWGFFVLLLNSLLVNPCTSFVITPLKARGKKIFASGLMEHRFVMMIMI